MSSAAPPTNASSRRDELIALANPANTGDPSRSERAARELRALASRIADEDLETEAWTWLCIHLLQQGRLHDAIAESQPLRERLQGVPPGTRRGSARMELLRTIALAGSEAGEFALALGAAQELAIDPAIQADAGAAYDAAFSLAVCLERMGDSWQAMRILTDVIEQHGEAAPSFPLLYTLNGIVATAVGAFHRTRNTSDGSDDEASTLLDVARDAAERAVALLDEFGNPLYRIAVVGNLGELLAFQGELDAAHECLQSALALAEEIGAAGHRDRVKASIGEWLMAVGRHQDALDWLEELLDGMGVDGPHSTRIRAHYAAYEAARSLGQFERALGHHEHFERLERRRTTHQLRSQSEMFVTRAEAQAEADRHRYTAERDPLTGLGNRRLLDRTLRQLLTRSADRNEPVSLALLDVDHFKTVNDEYGHGAGDAVLIELARMLTERVSDDAVVIRYGGEELVLVMPHTDIDDAAERCERLRAAIAEHTWPGIPADHRITASIGVASTPPYEMSRLLDDADRSLYDAKRAGRNLVRAAQPG